MTREERLEAEDGSWLEITKEHLEEFFERVEEMTNQEKFIKVFGLDAWQQMIVFSGLAEQFREHWTSPYKESERGMAEYINKSEVNGLLKLGWSGDAIVTAITNGGISSVPAIPIPEGATNGEVVEKIFGKSIYYTLISMMYVSCCEKLEKWWNAPYKGNLSEKPTGSESEDKE